MVLSSWTVGSNGDFSCHKCASMKITCVRVVAVYFRVQRYRPPIHDTLRTTDIDTGFRKITKSVRILAGANVPGCRYTVEFVVSYSLFSLFVQTSRIFIRDSFTLMEILGTIRWPVSTQQTSSYPPIPNPVSISMLAVNRDRESESEGVKVKTIPHIKFL